MNTKIALIKSVYDKTGVSIALAKEAVEAVGGSGVEDAIAYIKQKGYTPTHREDSPREGVIKTYNHQNKIGAILELNCHTDFVARSDTFQDLAHCILLQIVGANPSTLDELLSQPFVKDSSVTIKEMLTATMLAVQEEIVINRFMRWEM